MKTIKRRLPKIQDITEQDYLLLKQSYFLRSNQPDYFVCFGPRYTKLRLLDLIDDDNAITWYGRLLVKYLMPRVDV